MRGAAQPDPAQQRNALLLSFVAFASLVSIVLKISCPQPSPADRHPNNAFSAAAEVVDDLDAEAAGSRR